VATSGAALAGLVRGYISTGAFSAAGFIYKKSAE